MAQVHVVLLSQFLRTTGSAGTDSSRQATRLVQDEVEVASISLQNSPKQSSMFEGRM